MIREGTQVQWKWGSSHAEGEVVERHESEITRQIDGSEIKRKGTADNPALVIEQSDGQRVVKLQSEVSRADES
jgi:hypothetical protein